MELYIEKIKILFSNWKKSLSPEELRVIYEYTKYLYQELNMFLRDDIVENLGEFPGDIELKEQIELLEQALSKFELPLDVLVYRGESNNKLSRDEYIEIYSVMKEIKFREFLSTSLKLSVAENFIRLLKGKYPDQLYILIEALVLKGTKCAYLCKDLSAMGKECEILVSRNSKLQINEISKKYDDILLVKGTLTQF